MLKEAAQTEIRNTESLQQLVAMEEETKKKALEKRAKYVGPLVRVKSCKVNDMEQVLSLRFELTLLVYRTASI